MTIPGLKQVLRQRIIAAREKLPAPERLRLSRAVIESVCNLTAYRQGSVHGHMQEFLAHYLYDTFHRIC